MSRKSVKEAKERELLDSDDSKSEPTSEPTSEPEPEPKSKRTAYDELLQLKAELNPARDASLARLVEILLRKP